MHDQSFPPPSKPELERLKLERKAHQPRAAPTLRPSGSIGAFVDAAVARREAEKAISRETRITSVEAALSERKGDAKASQQQARQAGSPKADLAKAQTRKRERTL